MRRAIKLAALVLSFGICAVADASDIGTCRAKNGEAAARIAACSRLINAGNGSADVYIARGNAYSAAKDYDRAIADFDAALKIWPDLSDAFRGRGYAYLQRHEYRPAIKDYSAAIRSSAETGDYWARGYAYEQGGEYRSAIADYSSGIALRPQWGVLWDGRCWARAVIGVDLREALTDCDRAYHLRRSNGDKLSTLSHRAFVYFRLLRYSDALGEYNSVLAKQPENADVLFMRGIVRMRSGAADVRRALEIDGSVADRLKPLSNLALDGFEAAMKEYEKALRANPDDATTLYKRGFAWTSAGQADLSHARAIDAGVAAAFERYNVRP